MTKRSQWARMGVAAVAAVCLAVAWGAGRAGGADDDKEPNVWMKNKLRYAQNILSALMSEDYETITSNAKAMDRLGHLERWIHAKKNDYRAALKAFHDANTDLLAKSAAEDLKGTTQAYLKLTQSCVDCHKIVRDSKKK